LQILLTKAEAAFKSQPKEQPQQTSTTSTTPHKPD